ncbi:MAG: hypothetical protein KC877_05220 [Candidatus Kaiserbacteria bacterium]|nr:hypothetical protein [Candidatus Kaiserbacteria bacterium]MCB9816333.1 hypothetical protein [Candidatus Nomurabacteria bacterium]
MKDSIRRVAAALGVIGLLAFSVVTIQSIVTQCGAGQMSCLSAAVLFGVPQAQPVLMDFEMNHAAPTTIHTDTVPTMIGFTLSLIQATSVYLILLSVVMLVVLELFELRYLRHLLKVKRA